MANEGGVIGVALGELVAPSKSEVTGIKAGRHGGAEQRKSSAGNDDAKKSEDKKDSPAKKTAEKAAT